MTARAGGEATRMAAAALLLALELPLLIAVVGVGLRLARAVGVRIDRLAMPRPVPLPIFAAAPLQLVGAAEPSTKVCPACAAAVLGSATVCRRCHFTFPAPQRRAIRYTKAPAKAS